MGFQTEPPNYSSVVDYQGTPSSGEFPQFTDQNTLAGRTATQFLDALATGVTPAELGYLNGVTSGVQTQLDAKAAISGTPVADQLAAWTNATTVAGLPIFAKVLSHNALSNGALITTPFNSNGEYTIRLYRRISGSSSSGFMQITCVISGGAVSGTPHALSVATTSPPTNIRVGINGSGYLTIWLSNTSACAYEIQVVGPSTAPGTWGITDVTSTGTSSTVLAWVSALVVGTSDPGGSDPLRVGGAITHSGAVTMSGSPASAGASVRNRHGAGGTTHIVDNVSSSGGIAWAQNGTTILGFNADKSAAVDSTFAASLAAAIGAGAVTGSIAMWGTGSAPTGYLICDGSAVSRTTYATLFALIGTTFGAGNGSTTFNLPDLRGRTPIGVGTGSGLTARALADQVGVESVTLTAAQSGLPEHTHNIGGSASIASYAGVSTAAPGNGDSGIDSLGVVGGGQSASSSHTNMQPSLVINFIIKT